MYIVTLVRNAGLEEAQAGINIAGGNIHNFKQADGTNLMAESKEELYLLDEEEPLYESEIGE